MSKQKNVPLSYKERSEFTRIAKVLVNELDDNRTSAGWDSTPRSNAHSPPDEKNT